MNHDKRTAQPRMSFRISPVAVGCSLLIAATGAMAQQADTPQQLETVTVTGIRKGIEDAISVKRNSDSIVEAVSAEDIGKLPDTSIAESIARLPGLAAQRVNGRASAISVRGFSPDFATSLLNGREQVSTGDSRYVEFDQYPSELLSGVTVYKTPDAGLIGQGLSGTINMESARPLNFGQRVVAINYREVKLGKGLDTPAGSGSRVNFAYIDQFADRTIGVALGFARLKETLGTTQNFNSWGVNDVCPVADVGGKCPQATLGKAPGGFNDFIDSGDQKRDAFMGTLQWKPNKNFNSTLDVFVTKFDSTQLEQGVQVPLAPAFPGWGQTFAGTTVTPTTVTNGVITAGSIDGFKAISRNDLNANHDKVHSIGWNNQLVMGDWTGVLDLATSEAKRDAPHLETTASLPGNCKANPALCGSASWTGFDGTSVQSAKYTFPYAPDDLSKIQLTDAAGWGGGVLPQAGYSKIAHTDDELNAFRLSAKRNLDGGFFADVDLGFNYSDRKKTRTYVEGRLIVGSPTDPVAAVPVPGGVAAVAPQTGTPYVAWNPDGSVGSIYTIAAKLVPDIANKNWVVSEKVATAYAKLGIDSELFGIPVRGNAGVQLVHTDQSSTAFSADRATPCPGDVCDLGSNTVGKKYYDVLPSMNLVGDLGNGNTVRFGLARQLARPTLDDMRASLNLNATLDATNGNRLTGDGGNTKLNPFRAIALDLSYEKYWGKQAYVSVAGFYKKLSSYILRSPTQFDFSDYITANTPPTASPIGVLTAPTNGSGGNISGVELAASMPLNIVSSWLDGFGLQANYARTHSSVSLPSSGFKNGVSTATIPMPGLSKEVRGFALYFEKWGFEARLGQRYRSDFLGSIADQYGDNQLIYIKSERVTDAQVSYSFQQGWLKGLTLLVQANNVKNEPYVEFKETPADPSVKRRYGKTYLMGVNYKF
ncbi:MAG: TonB-dependent receptor [Roseateles sp.]|uniref:TonB-dependent receptor n=1 Tax=Roseateles sp. TaxID=1971397 RepID=UPI0039ED1B5D